MSDREHARSPVETALEYCVYAPLGFGLEARSLLPRFVDRGRNQIVLARVIGKYAIRKGSEAAEGLLGPAGAPAMSLLRGLGLLPPEPSPPPPDSATTVPAAPAGPNGERRAAGEPTGPTGAPAPAGRPQPPFPAETLAIPDYDSLSASQVVPRLEGLTAEELEAVRTYESATRGRQTILNKIAQLQSG
ncbi:hypothetical protein [Rhabdothermincola sediminis]|uniref:hypothetical protein n=1 Tax=Rhabdothermincola sediminis TaxID=2751370 RepID=UPI001AA06537|nr:hypothetical protein [Rhabdothermincola sediminis]